VIAVTEQKKLSAYMWFFSIVIYYQYSNCNQSQDCFFIFYLSIPVHLSYFSDVEMGKLWIKASKYFFRAALYFLLQFEGIVSPVSLFRALA